MATKISAHLTAVIIAIVSICSVGLVAAQDYKSTYVNLAAGVPGLLYEPLNPGPKAHIAILAMHPGGDYLTNPVCTEMAGHGYTVLCANCFSSKSGLVGDQDIDKLLLNVKLGVQYLRKNPKIAKIVLFGHSGGGGMMSAYQNIAENGVKICQGPEKLVKCPNALADLPAADGLMLIDSTFSMSGMSLVSLDPAITSDDNGVRRNPDLDLFNPQNGYNPKGSTYSDEFKRKFWAAQRDMELRLIAKAQGRLKLIESGNGNFKDDEPFYVPSGSPTGNKMFTQDLSLWKSTQAPWPLLHPDGSITTEIVHSVRVPEGGASKTPTLVQGGLRTTVRGFLSTYALRPLEDFGYDATTIRGIDFKSSYANTAGNVEGVTVPLLQMGMTGSYEFFVAENVRRHAKSQDKTLAYVEGALHTFAPCKQCAVANGSPENYYGDTIKTLFNYMDKWLNKPGRFAEAPQ